MKKRSACGMENSMILADKIIALRKRNGWSQEELAEKIGVSRQAVSKWEGAQSIPDLDKVLLLSRLFGVSVDYLLKDELETEEYTKEPAAEEPEKYRRVSMEEANEFLSLKEQTAKQVALGTFLCILSPICLFMLPVAAETKRLPITEEAAGALGMVALLLIVAAATAIFIACGMKTRQFEFLEKEPIETEYGVSGMVRERQKSYSAVYTRYNILGTCICILAAIPLLMSAFLAQDEFIIVSMLSVTMALAGIGTIFFVIAGINWASMQKLLEEGDYSREKKKKSDVICAVYWLLVTAVYLGWSFRTENWQETWIIWPVAAVLFAAFVLVRDMLLERKKS